MFEDNCVDDVAAECGQASSLLIREMLRTCSRLAYAPLVRSWLCGLGMLYATLRPNSLLGCIFIGPFAAAGRLASVSRYLSGALGFVLTAAGAAILIIG